jgi:hypothetical protein
MPNFELPGVELLGCAGEDIASITASDPIPTEGLAEKGQMALESLIGPGRRFLVPDVFDEEIGRDGPIG